MKLRYCLFPLALSGFALVPLSVSAFEPATTVDVRAFLGAGLGYYRLNDGDFLEEDESLDDDRFSWKVFGGFEVNRVFSMEVGYVDFGKTADGLARMEVDGWTLAGIAAIPVTPFVAPYGKVGQLFWDRDREFGPMTASDDGSNMFYGLGVRFTLADRADLRVEYERFSMSDTDLDMASISAQYRF